MALTATLHDQSPDVAAFEREILAGLTAPRKKISCKFFYDAHGSQLFERITELDAYYPTRTEMAILRDCRAEIAALVGPQCQLVDFGAGSTIKASLLLEALDSPIAYIPVDISRDHLIANAGQIARKHPGLRVTALCADFTRVVRLPKLPGGEERPYVGFFPGSTIGNFSPSAARKFLERARRTLRNGAMLVGVDLKKPVEILHRAYNDPEGVTAAFNLNLLTRINRELGANFRVELFRHRAYFRERYGRIEMNLICQEAHDVRVAGHRIAFAKDEVIHTENSYKFSIDQFSKLARGAGYNVRHVWRDAGELFSVIYLEAQD